MKKKQWVAPSVVASFLLGSVMTAQVLYQNNMLPSFRGIASDEVVTEVVENVENNEVVEDSNESDTAEITEVTLEKLQQHIDSKITESKQIKEELAAAVEEIKKEELKSSEVQEVFDTKVTPAMTKYENFYTDDEVLSALNGITSSNVSFSDDVTDEIKSELMNKLGQAHLEIGNFVLENGENLYDDQVNIRISKLKDKEIDEKLAAQEAAVEAAKEEAKKAAAKVQDLEARVCEQTNKIDDLIEKVEKLVEPAQGVTDGLNYTYGMTDYFGMQNSLMSMYMNPMMMYSPFSMSMMNPYSMFMNPYSSMFSSPYSMGLGGYGYPGIGIGGSGKNYGALSELQDYERDYYGVQAPVAERRVNDSTYGINYNDLRLGNDFEANVDLQGGQTVMKVPQYSRSVANDVQTISVQ